MDADSFGVYVAGEQIAGLDGITYIRVTTPIGDLRMTEAEAEDLGHKLIYAAGLYAGGEAE